MNRVFVWVAGILILVSSIAGCGPDTVAQQERVQHRKAVARKHRLTRGGDTPQNVHEMRLSDGTRCVWISQWGYREVSVAMSCDWAHYRG